MIRMPATSKVSAEQYEESTGKVSYMGCEGVKLVSTESFPGTSNNIGSTVLLNEHCTVSHMSYF